MRLKAANILAIALKIHQKMETFSLQVKVSEPQRHFVKTADGGTFKIGGCLKLKR